MAYFTCVDCPKDQRCCQCDAPTCSTDNKPQPLHTLIWYEAKIGVCDDCIKLRLKDLFKKKKE